jgi:hypothetical protein
MIPAVLKLAKPKAPSPGMSPRLIVAAAAAICADIARERAANSSKCLEP